MILVGEDPASAVYVRNKVKACADAGLHSVLEQYPADLTEAELLKQGAAAAAQMAARLMREAGDVYQKALKARQ